MKLPNVLTGLLSKKEDTKEYFFSLYLDLDAAAVSVWYIDPSGDPKIASFAHALIADDTWEARIQVVDRLLSAAEDKVGVAKAISKTVFGMPAVYLTEEGNIQDSVRPHLKKLSSMLELTPVGFVPLSQAIAFSLKNNEGVPPSVILIGGSKMNTHITLFRVGQVTHEETVEFGDDPTLALETVLKKHKDGEVLPSRMLLYGGNNTFLEETRAKLLKHPWPARANFLHFPKIELVSLESLLTSVSLAGAAELASDIGENAEAEATTVVAQPSREEEEIDQEVEEGEIEEEESEEDVEEEVSNVEMVTPESLGFRNADVLEHPPKMELPKLSASMFSGIASLFGRMPKMRGQKFLPILIIGLVLLALLGFGLYYMLPKVTVTVLVASQSIDESSTIIVDPDATSADTTSKVIPGKLQEQSISGEKTIAVTGKKSIGDPAKGAVIIYNKVTNGKTFSKGAELAANGVTFTLDSDVSVASASESIGSITFGKATVNVTAKNIGPNGNLSASSEFTFANTSASSVSARNETAFTGGTSKQVTVVSRADQDALVKLLTDELVVKAKEQLKASVSGAELIDQTIKTAVEEKEFSAELDQEVKELSGKVTIKVTGVSVADGDIKSLLSSLVEAKIPSGYTLAPEQTTVSTSNVTVKKIGTITMTATLTAVALPEIDADGLRNRLAGKSADEGLLILKETNGVAGAEYRFVMTPFTSRLPLKSGNITITVMVQ